jgi:hypothetical protein
VNIDLVVRDKHGEIYPARYHAMNTMLLNHTLKRIDSFNSSKENLKSHCAIEPSPHEARTASIKI